MTGLNQTNKKVFVSLGVEKENYKYCCQGGVEVMVVSESNSDKNHSILSCDNVIITATAKAVSFMEFQPPLDYKKKNALDTLSYFDSVKIFLVFSRAFWSEPNNLPIIPYNSSNEQNGASAISDDLARVVREDSNVQKLIITINVILFFVL